MTESGRGGARAGAGRPKKTPGENAQNRTIRLNKTHWAKYLKNGGTKTLRYLLDSDLFRGD